MRVWSARPVLEIIVKAIPVDDNFTQASYIALSEGKVRMRPNPGNDTGTWYACFSFFTSPDASCAIASERKRHKPKKTTLNGRILALEDVGSERKWDTWPDGQWNFICAMQGRQQLTCQTRCVGRSSGHLWEVSCT